MAADDSAELVTLRLTFWHKGKAPGDTVEVRPEEIRSWHGFAVRVDDEPASAEPAKTSEATPAAPKPPAKPAGSK